MATIGIQPRSTSPRDEARMTLMEHLGELRSRILKVVIMFLLAVVVAWFFHERIFDLLLAPAPSLEGHLNVTTVTEQVIADLKLALYAAFLLTVPVLLYQAWAFVAPSVGEVGRAFSYVLVMLASSLFLAGVAFGYFVVLPIGVDFLLSWDPGRYEAIITPTSYFSFVTRFLLAFGIVFELPAATYVGAKLGLIDAPLLRRHRRHALVIVGRPVLWRIRLVPLGGNGATIDPRRLASTATPGYSPECVEWGFSEVRIHGVLGS